MYDAGDVVVVPFPFTDLTSSKQRPALVLAGDSEEASRRDVILCAMTSNLTRAAHSVLIEQDDLKEGILPRTSRVKVGRLTTLDRDLVRKRVGRIGEEPLKRVHRELRILLGLA